MMTPELVRKRLASLQVMRASYDFVGEEGEEEGDYGDQGEGQGKTSVRKSVVVIGEYNGGFQGSRIMDSYSLLRVGSWVSKDRNWDWENWVNGRCRSQGYFIRDRPAILQLLLHLFTNLSLNSGLLSPPTRRIARLTDRTFWRKNRWLLLPSLRRPPRISMSFFSPFGINLSMAEYFGDAEQFKESPPNHHLLISLFFCLKNVLGSHNSNNYKSPYPFTPQQTINMQTGHHTVTQNEKIAFTDHVNSVLKNDPTLHSRLPIDPKSIFNAVTDGIILCKLVNVATPGTIPQVAINMKTPLNVWQQTENLNLAISSAQSIGCVVVNMNPQYIREKKEHIVLGLIWQVIRIYIFRNINLRSVPELIVLKKEEEDADVVFKLKPEDILLRWLNYFLAMDGSKKVVKNFGKDVSDGEAYGHLFKHLTDDFKEDYWGLNPQQRADRILQHCKKLHIVPYIKSQDIVNGTTRLNLLFAAQVFNSHHGLKLQKKVPVPAPIVQPQTDQSREIKVFKNWINSMGLEDVYVNWLIDDLKDGRVLLKVIERFRPGLVNWSEKYSEKHSIFVWVANDNYVIDLMRANFKQVTIVNIGGKDIAEGKTSLVLGLVWQLCKLYWIERTGDIPEAQLLEWANSRVPADVRVKNFKDKSLSNCKFLLKLIESIEPKVVDYNLLSKENTPQAQQANIKYTISTARKLGAEVMLLWEHINEANSKFIHTFVAELHHQAKAHNKL